MGKNSNGTVVGDQNEIRRARKKAQKPAKGSGKAKDTNGFSMDKLIANRRHRELKLEEEARLERIRINGLLDLIHEGTVLFFDLTDTGNASYKEVKPLLDRVAGNDRYFVLIGRSGRLIADVRIMDLGAMSNLRAYLRRKRAEFEETGSVRFKFEGRPFWFQREAREMFAGISTVQGSDMIVYKARAA